MAGGGRGEEEREGPKKSGVVIGGGSGPWAAGWSGSQSGLLKRVCSSRGRAGRGLTGRASGGTGGRANVGRASGRGGLKGGIKLNTFAKDPRSKMNSADIPLCD